MVCDRSWEHVTFAKSWPSRENRRVACLNLTMTPEQEQALQAHIQVIAKILYEDTPPEQLETLAGIEQAVRQQMQKHVMPEVGIF
jgi:hypothetical protein